MTIECQARFLSRLADGSASAVRRAMDDRAGGRRRWFLACQVVLRAMRLILVPPERVSGACPDPALAVVLEGIDPETAAVVLVHLAGDVLQDEAHA
jgi:hypothetical protein